MFLINTITSVAVETVSSNSIDWNLFFTAINTGIAAFSAWCAYASNKNKDEVVKIKNTINTEIENEIEIAIKNNVSAQAVASIIFNDEEKIKELATNVANTLITERTPKFHLEENGILNIDIPESSHTLKLTRK